MLFESMRKVRGSLKELFRLNTEISHEAYGLLLGRYPSCRRDIIIELFTFLYSLCDYQAAKNKMKKKYRQRIYRSYGRQLVFSKLLKGELLTRSTVDDYMDYRIEIYAAIFNHGSNELEDKLLEIVDYQTELIMSIAFDNQMSLYDPFDHENKERQKVDREQQTRSSISDSLHTYYREVLPPYIERIRQGLTDELFKNKDYAFPMDHGMARERYEL